MFPSSATPAAAFQPLSADRGPHRVLVVDDEPGMRNMLRRALEPNPFDVVLAETGAEALRLFANEPFDVILSDLMMPEMTGIELLSSVRASNDRVAFVVLTGASTLESAVQALREGADDYLLKPFEIRDLRLALTRAVSRRRLVRENQYYRANLEQRVEEQSLEIERLFEDALLAITNAVEARDGYTAGHTKRVTEYAVAIGEEMGLAPEALRNLRVSALLHDIGKIGIPDGILSKAGPLDAAEAAIMQRHPTIGASILGQSPSLHRALNGVLCHHERWDGLGYPRGLRGEEIPLEARILAAADAYDAIITPRPYRPARSEAEAAAEIEVSAGGQFDPAVVEAFLRILGTSPAHAD